MYRTGHLGTSLLLYSPILYILLELNQPLFAILGLGIIITCSSIPDLDMKVPFVKHRGYSHSLIGAVLMAIPIGMFGYFGQLYLGEIIKNTSDTTLATSPTVMGAFCFILGLFTIITHYAGDIVTPSGIPILAPYSKTYYSLNWFYAKNKIANAVALFLGVTATILVFIHPLIIQVMV